MHMESKSNRGKFLFKITSQTLKKYKDNGVYFRKPRLVAYYDCNYEKITHARRIDYFTNPKSDQYPLDLTIGFESYIPRIPGMTFKKIELSLKYDMTSAAQRDGVENLEMTKVITRRGVLAYIMELFYYNYASTTIRVSRYNGNLYIETDDSDALLEELLSVNTHHKQLERLLFSDSPSNRSSEINKPLDENIVLVGMYRSNFGKYDIIYSGEIQGIISNEKIKDFDDLNALNDCHFVFAKQMWMNIKHKDNKYLKIWLQTYLANVKDIYIGYKTEDGIIEEPIEHKISTDLPKDRFWKPSVCTGILYEFLQNVERRMSDVNCLNTVYAFNFNRKEKSFNYEIFRGKTDKTFITKEYMEYCKKNFI